MSIESSAFLGAMVGGASAIVFGRLILHLLDYLRERAGKTREVMTEALEWAIPQPGTVLVEETQVGNNWVRTYDVRRSFMSENDDGPLPCSYATQIVGSMGTPDPIPGDCLDQARENHRREVASLRIRLGLPVKI